MIAAEESIGIMATTFALIIYDNYKQSSKPFFNNKNPLSSNTPNDKYPADSLF